MTNRWRAVLALIAVVLMTLGSGPMSSATAAGPGDQVCQGLDSGKKDTTGDPLTVTVAAPDGKLIDGYCVKAGSSGQGDGPVYVDVVPAQKSVTISYPGGKAVSHYSVSYTDDLPTQPDSKVTYTEWADGDKSCESKTVTQARTKIVTPYKWNGSAWVLDTANATSTTETKTRPMTADELQACAGDQPDSKVTYSDWVEGAPNCESKTVTKTRTKTVTPYRWNGSEWVLDTANATSTTETETRPLTEAELKECEGTPPPDDTCPPLTGSVKTTLADGSVVNGNIYTNKSDVYVSGSQLGDVTTVYVRVTDPSGSTVLSDVKQVSVVDGSFGPVQLPSFADTPNNGGEYKVWVSSSTNFEPKCTKFDNFKVRGEEPPLAPAGMSKFSVDCESLEIKAPTGVKPEDATYQYYLNGEAIAVGSHELAPGDYTLTLKVDGEQVDSDPITIEECEEPPSYVVTVIPNQGDCEVRTPVARVTTGFASSIGYRPVGGEATFVYPEAPAGTYTLMLPGIQPGASFSYEVVVTPLDDSAEPIVKGPFSFSVPKDCDEVPPCIKFQDEDAGMPCYVEREPDVRTDPSERDNCKLGGTVTTTAVYTTTWSFNEVTQQWESSETADSSSSFEPYTAEQLAACNKTPDNPTVPTADTPTFVPPSTGGGVWPTSDFGSVQSAGMLSKLLVLLGSGLLLVTVFAPRRRRGTI